MEERTEAEVDFDVSHKIQ